MYLHLPCDTIQQSLVLQQLFADLKTQVNTLLSAADMSDSPLPLFAAALQFQCRKAITAAFEAFFSQAELQHHFNEPTLPARIRQL